ncbi:MAG: inositol-1-monophosphatase [Arsenophonus sp.]
MHPMLTIAIRAVRKAGDFIAKRYEKFNSIEIITKGQNDFIVNSDKQSEQIIINIIQKSYPLHSIFTKEKEKMFYEKKDVQWFINPLDGIINFTKRLPHFSVSIAIRINGRTEIAVIYNPMLNELFTAVRGQSAQLNGYRLRLKNINNLEGAIIAISFPFKFEKYSKDYFNIIDKLFKKCVNFRCTGSETLDLAYVAAGRVDIFFESSINQVGFIAGELLVREAGGIITDFVGGHNYFTSGNFLAGNPRLVKKMVLEIENKLNDSLKY